MKWIGQEIYDLVSRFRSDVYLDGVSTSTETDMLVVDSNNKISKRAFSTFMTNGLDNRVLTATGANGINAESYLMFDGTYGATFLYLQPIANTVNDCFTIDAHALTTGSGITLDIEDSLTTAANKSLIKIDYDKSGVTDSGALNVVTGLNVSLVDAATNDGGTISTGVSVAIDAASDQGNINQTGYSATLTDGDVANTVGYYSNVEDGGIDFKAVSSADTGDMFTIATTTHGATTLTTTDDDATAAHFEIAADGNITLDSANDIYLESTNFNYLYGRTLHVENNISSHGTNVLIMDQQNSADEKIAMTFTKDKGDAGADGDSIFGIYAKADNAAQQLTDFASINTAVITAADTDEAGALALKVATSNGDASALQNGLLAVGHGTNNDIDITLGYGSTSETTIAGNLTVTSDLTVSGTTTTVNTTNLNIEDKNITLNYNASSDTSGTADGAGITIQDAVDASNDALFSWDAGDNKWKTSHSLSVLNASSGGIPALIVNNQDVDQLALDINADNTTANVIDIDARALTGGKAINIDSNNIAGGSLINLDVGDTYTQAPILSHSSSPTKLINIDYDKSGVTDDSGVGRYVNALDISMVDAATNHINSINEFTGINIEIDAASAQGSIRQKGVKVTLTDGDTVIGSSGPTSAAFWSNTEDGGTDFFAQSSADIGDYFAIQTTTHGATTLKTVDDDATAAHLTFDIDGDIKNDAASGDYYWYQNGNTDDYLRLLIGTDGSARFVTVDAAAANADFEIEADGNIILDPQNATNGVQIDGTANTTANALNIDCNALTTGSAIFVDVDTILSTTNTLDCMKIDYDKSSNVESGQTVAAYGLEIDMNDNATSNVGNTQMTGIHIGIDSANANGLAMHTGVAVSLTDADTALTTGFSSFVEDGGIDFKAMSSADSSDYFAIATTTHGATTLTTIDNDAAAAHFEIAADGDITLDAEGNINLDPDSSGVGQVNFKRAGTRYADFSYHHSASYLTMYENGGASEDDFMTLAVAANGATTLMTRDNAAAAAHFEIEADGNITLDPAGTIALEADTTVSGDLTVNGGNATINGGDTADAILKLATNTASASDDVIIELVTDEDGTPRQARIGVDHSDNTLKLVHGSGFSGGTNGICVDSGGKVGIGIAAPTEELEVYRTGENAQIAITRGTDTQLKLKAQDNQTRITYEGGPLLFDSDESGTNTLSLGSSGTITTTGAIELGHASDTTIARSAAGTVTIEGEQIATNIYTKKIVISQAEMNSLATTPKELVAAPGSNKFIDVLSFNLIVDRASTNTVSAYLSCSYNGDATLGGALFLRKSFMLNKTTDTYYPVMRYTTDAGNTDPINKSVTAQLQGAITTNCTTSTTVLITYSIIDVS